MKQLLELPLNLTIVSPAHTPNWDLVSDVVNSCSRIYRSPKQCRNRYENVIIPREEGKVMKTGSCTLLSCTHFACLSQQSLLGFFPFLFFFLSWCMRQTPRRKPRVYTRYSVLLGLCVQPLFLLEFWGSFLFFLCVHV